MPSVPFEACGNIENGDDLYANVALMKRGYVYVIMSCYFSSLTRSRTYLTFFKSDCSFMTKAINAEKAGAIAAIIMNNEEDNDLLIDMIDDNTDRVVNIPALFLTWRDG